MSIVGSIDTDRAPYAARHRSAPRVDRPPPAPGAELEVMRCVFYALLVLAVAILSFDVTSIVEGWKTPRPAAPQVVEVVPRIVQADPVETSRREADLSPARRLFAGSRNPMRFSMRSGGVLTASGMIEPGTTKELAAEIRAHDGAITTLSLDSPGGSLDEAIAMARLVRENGISTEVADGAVCASSCPLILAGGVARHVGDDASVGIHQFYSSAANEQDAAQAMSDAQLATARIARHLKDMGVDPLVWLNALATPPNSLYRLTRSEMVRYRLITPSSSNSGRPASSS